jgi:hypothetical protein
MHEILTGIRVIKMYAWEGAFSNVIADLRKYKLKFLYLNLQFFSNFRAEISKVRQSACWQSLILGTFYASGKLVMLFAILCFVLTGNDLSAERIFVSVRLHILKK